MTIKHTPTRAAPSNRILALGALLIVLGLLAWRLSDVLVLMFGAVIVAVALQAFAAPLERFLRVKHQLAVAAAVALTLAVVVLGSWLAGDRLLAQTEDLRQRLPEAMATRTLGALGSIGLVLGVYLAADPQLYRRGLVRLVPLAWRARVDGALLAFMQGPQQALYVAGLCIAIQQVEGNLLMPFVQLWAVDLPAVLGIIAAVIFGLLFGLPGVILATPLMVVLIVLIEKLYVEAVLEAKPPMA